MKILKKIYAVLLSVILISGIAASTPVTANAMSVKLNGAIMNVGDTKTLSVDVYPGTDEAVVAYAWTSSDNSVAQIQYHSDSKSCVFKALKAGTADIMCLVYYNKYYMSNAYGTIQMQQAAYNKITVNGTDNSFSTTTPQAPVVNPTNGPSAVSASGKCGSNVSWSLKNGNMYLTGSGSMNNYNDLYRAPYNTYSSSTYAVWVNGPSTIGGCAFFYMSNIGYASIGGSVKSIGERAFCGCTGLSSIYIPDSVTSIGSSAFSGCLGLKEITIPKSVTSIGNGAFSEVSSNFVIKGYSGSYAETYAKSNNIKFVDLNPSYEPAEQPTTAYVAPATEYPQPTTEYIEPTTEKLPAATVPHNITQPVEVSDKPEQFNVEASNNKSYTQIDFFNITDSKNQFVTFRKWKIEISVAAVNLEGKTKFSSSKPSVASVKKIDDYTFMLNSKKAGTTTISATNNGVTAKLKVKVVNPKLFYKKKTLKKGSVWQIYIDGEVGKQVYKSSNKKVASVSKSGKVKAKKKGKATITIKTNGIKLKCKIKVR